MMIKFNFIIILFLVSSIVRARNTYDVSFYCGNGQCSSSASSTASIVAFECSAISVCGLNGFVFLNDTSTPFSVSIAEDSSCTEIVTTLQTSCSVCNSVTILQTDSFVLGCPLPVVVCPDCKHASECFPSVCCNALTSTCAKLAPKCEERSCSLCVSGSIGCGGAKIGCVNSTCTASVDFDSCETSHDCRTSSCCPPFVSAVNKDFAAKCDLNDACPACTDSEDCDQVKLVCKKGKCLLKSVTV